MARALMVCGTASHVGKSLLCAAFCRIFADDGLTVLPFKAQNMSNNAAVAAGGEIGRAQALQARAAKVDASVHMNPILLKPEGEARSQVVVHGKSVGSMAVDEYHRYKLSHGRQKVMESYEIISAQADVVVIEGAGSPVEINLKAHDIANLWMAQQADANVLLVGDIDRGGVIAALVGTMELMTEDERARVAGLVINKFRGERSLLIPALEFLEDRYGKKVLGVIPHIDHHLPEEDGLGIPAHRDHAAGRLRVGIVRLPRIANFTDFDPLALEPDISLAYVDKPEQVTGLDLLILPGSKATLADLDWLNRRGLTTAITRYANAGGHVIGICGGYQMLGTTVSDPHGVEGGGDAEGLSLLPVSTELAADKRCLKVHYSPLPDAGLGSQPVAGYEIHMGRTRTDGAPLFANSPAGTGVRQGNVWGSYLHGLFENDAARREVLAPLRRAAGLADPAPVSWAATLEAQIDGFSGVVRKHLDMEALHDAF